MAKCNTPRMVALGENCGRFQNVRFVANAKMTVLRRAVSTARTRVRLCRSNKMEYAQILPRLYIGSHPTTIEDIELLRRNLAVTAVLNLQTDEDMQSTALDFKPLEAYYRALPLSLVRIPMMEEQAVLREKLAQAVAALDRLLAADQTVYLHCTAGIARAPSVAIGYLYSRLGWEVDVAVTHVKQLRQCSPYLDALRLSLEDEARRNSHNGTPTQLSQ